VLPAYLVGLVVAGVFFCAIKHSFTGCGALRSRFSRHFYFIKAGLFRFAARVVGVAGTYCHFVADKNGDEIHRCLAAHQVFYMRNREANYTTLLMATGLTFGTISALFGLQNKIIDQSAIHGAGDGVILSAFVPTLIAQEIFPAHN